jgi:hypothetical protein
MARCLQHSAAGQHAAATRAQLGTTLPLLLTRRLLLLLLRVMAWLLLHLLLRLQLECMSPHCLLVFGKGPTSMRLLRSER